jgi:predicted transcriptional regulator
MANAANKVRDVFKAAQCELTLAEIKEAMPELKSNEVSMALCYFRKQRYLTRKQVENKSNKGRKSVWIYTFHETRLPKPEPVTA